MKNILCFGDSNTWGLIPGTTRRYSWEKRWTGILQELYIADGYRTRIIEEGLCGRTTVFEDSYRKNRKGVDSLPLILETNYPVDAAVIMLGTNDCKTIYNNNAYSIAKGMEQCVDYLLKYIAPENIFLVSPIHLGENVWKPEYDPEFNVNSVGVSKALEAEYRKLAIKKSVNFLAASDYAVPSEIDNEHMDETGHNNFAGAVYKALTCRSLSRVS